MKFTKRLVSFVICLLLMVLTFPVEMVSAENKNGITIKDSSVILGDANEDGKVNVKDATSIQKYAAAIITLTDNQLEAADVNADSKINIKDATAIQKWIAGLLEDSNINSPIVSPSEPETEGVTVTEPITVPATESVTVPETESVTVTETESVTGTEPITVPETESVTVPETEPVTEPTTVPATEVPTETDSDTYDYVSFNFLTEGFTNVRITDEKSAIEAVGSVADVLGITDAKKELKVINVNTVEGDSFYRMQQYYSDIPIYGRAVNICADSDGIGQSLNHNFIQINDVDVTASITESEAKQIVINKYGDSVQITNCQLSIYSLFDYVPTLAWQIQIVSPSLIETCFVDAHSGDLISAFSEIFTESELSTFSDSAGTIDFYTLKNDDGTYSLIDKKRNLHVYDANNQTVTYAFIDDKGIMYIYDSDKKTWTTTNGHEVDIKLSEDGTNTFDVYYDNNIIGRNASYFPCVGSPLTSLQVITNPTNVWTNRKAALAMSLTEDNYDFYKEIFNRDGFNDNNGTVRISINDDINGDPKNAYSAMGNSDIITVLNFGHAINISSDLVGHEYNHSVEDSLSSLVYYKEAGAIKEALADVFGELFEDWQSDQQLDNDCDWIHGDRNMIDPSSSMQNDKCYYEYNGQSCPVFEKNEIHYIGDEVKEPGLLFPGTCTIDIPYPEYYKGNGYYYGSGDHGGVHTNCTVLSHAAYLMTHPENSEVDALTNEELARVLYRTLHYLPVDCEFDTFAFYVCMSARVLGFSDAKRDCIAEAFEKVGIENATFALSEIVKNKFDFTVLSSKETENVHFKLEVIKMPEVLIGPGLVNDELPELIMEKTAITGKQSLELEDGTYVLRITDLGDDSISQAINVKIVVDDKNTKAKDQFIVNTDFTDVIVVGIDGNDPNDIFKDKISRINYYDSDNNLIYYEVYAYYDNGLLCSTTLYSVSYGTQGDCYYGDIYTWLYLYNEDGELTERILGGLTISSWYDELTGKIILGYDYDENGNSSEICIYPNNESIEQEKFGVDVSKTETIRDNVVVVESDPDVNWSKVYLDNIFVNDVPPTDQTSCRLVYIDDNSIPELWLDYGYGYAGAEIYTQNGNSTDKIRLSHGVAKWIEKENLLLTSNGHQDIYFHELYKTSDGKFVLLDRGDYGAIGTNGVQVDENNRPIYNYYWNDIKMSETEYKNKLQNAFDNSKATNIYQNVYTYEQCIKLLESFAKYDMDNNNIEQEIISTYGLSSEEQFISCVGADINAYPESIYGVLSMTWLDVDNDNNEELVVVRVAPSDNGSEAQIICEVFSEEKGEYSCTASSVICTLSYNISSYIYLYYSDEIGSYCVVTDSSYTGSYTGIDSVTAQVFTLSKNSVCEYVSWSVVPSFGISADFGVEFSKTGVPFAKNCTIYDKTSETVYYQPLCEVKHEVYGDAYVYSDRTHKLCVSAFSEDNVVGNGTHAVGCDEGIYYWTYSESNVNPEYTLIFENNDGETKEIYSGNTRGEIYMLNDVLVVNQEVFTSPTTPRLLSAVVMTTQGELIEEISDFLVVGVDDVNGEYVLYHYYDTDDLYETKYYVFDVYDNSFEPAPWSDEDVHFVNANNGIVYYYVNTDDDRGVILYSYSVENECSEELSTSYIEYYDSGPGYGSSPCTIYHLQETENTIYYSCVYTAGSGNYIQRAKLVMYDKVSGKNIELTDDIYEIGADFYVYIENGVEKVICYNDNLNSNVIISDRGNSIEATDRNVQLIGKPYREDGTGVDVSHYLYLDDSGDNIQILPATSVDNADDYVVVYIENVCYTGEYTFYDIDYHKLNPNSTSWRDTSITDKLETYRYNMKTGETELICSMKYE